MSKEKLDSEHIKKLQELVQQFRDTAQAIEDFIDDQSPENMQRYIGSVMLLQIRIQSL